MVLPLTTNHNELDYFLEICGSFLLTGGHDYLHLFTMRYKNPGVVHAANNGMKWKSTFKKTQLKQTILY